MIPDKLPRSSGTYALQLSLPQACLLQVGRLGTFNFSPGEYVYLGSARGPGGLRARLGRHIRYRQGDRDSSRPYWHIDYLRRLTHPHSFCYLVQLPEVEEGQQPLECRWSQALAELPRLSVPVPGFGASDCRCGCQAHLVACHTSLDGMHPGGLMDDIRRGLTEAAGVPAGDVVCVGIDPA